MGRAIAFGETIAFLSSVIPAPEVVKKSPNPLRSGQNAKEKNRERWAYKLMFRDGWQKRFFLSRPQDELYFFTTSLAGIPVHVSRLCRHRRRLGLRLPGPVAR